MHRSLLPATLLPAAVARWSRGSIVALAAVSLLACNQYDVYLVSGYEQSSFSNEADVLFVIDNSPSMQDEAEALALNFQTFLDYLTNSESGAAFEAENLSDAVSNYVSYVSDRGRLLDFQLAITTTSMAPGTPGAAGALVGDVLAKGADALEEAFQQDLLCEATCWNTNDVPSDPNYLCGDPIADISLQVLDCVCGLGAWENHCGAGTEEGLEAAWAAMCRAVDDPPESCFIETDDKAGISQADAGTNAGLLREDSTLIVVVVTDEGDGSRRLGQGDSDPAPYLELFNSLGVAYKFAVIGPPYDPDDGSMICNSGGAIPANAERYFGTVAATGGFYNPIAEEAPTGACQVSDFSRHLEDLGDLLVNLLTAFPLNAVPDTATIRVYVDGEPVPESVLDPAAEDGYGSGWSYDPGLNAVVFHGDAVPEYNADVRIYFEPLQGNPRQLPF